MIGEAGIRWFVDTKDTWNKSSLPKSVIRLDLQNNNVAINNDNVEPHPPNVANKSLELLTDDMSAYHISFSEERMFFS